MQQTTKFVKKKRKVWFKVLKTIMKIRYKRPAFVYLGEKFKNGSIILSNHEGTDAPMSLEIWNRTPSRMWGTYQMNSGLVQMYKYQTKVYYHEKKHWNLHAARAFCLIASPLTNMFYSGLNLISTYQDTRLMKTLKESLDAIKKGENVVIYPEVSTKGYLAELEGFHAGFVLLAETCLKKGIDTPIYVTYFKKKEGVYVIDKPVFYSELAKKYKTKEEIAKALLNRCNQLGKMQFDKQFIEQTKFKNIQEDKIEKQQEKEYFRSLKKQQKLKNNG